MPDELPAEVEDSRIVTKCRLLLEFFLADPFVNALLHLASLEDTSKLGVLKISLALQFKSSFFNIISILHRGT